MVEKRPRPLTTHQILRVPIKKMRKIKSKIRIKKRFKRKSKIKTLRGGLSHTPNLNPALNPLPNLNLHPNLALLDRSSCSTTLPVYARPPRMPVPRMTASLPSHRNRQLVTALGYRAMAGSENVRAGLHA